MASSWLRTLETQELVLECLCPGADPALPCLLFAARQRSILEAGNNQHVMHQQILTHEREIPLFLRIELAEHVLDALRHALLDHLLRFGLQLFPAFERERSQRIDHFTLLVHHIVILQKAFARLEVLELDALLRLLDGSGDERVREHLALLGPHAVHQLRNPIRSEESHEVVFEATGRTATPGSPDGRHVRAAGDRCGVIRGALSR